VTKREKSKMEMELQNIASCDINNLMIDIGNIAKELESDNDCPVRLRYIVKGIYEEVYKLRTYTGHKISEIVNKIDLESDL